MLRAKRNVQNHRHATATATASSGLRASTQPSRKGLPILQATTDLILWFVPLRNGLPRDQKFALGDRIITNLDTALEGPAAAPLDLLRIQPACSTTSNASTSNASTPAATNMPVGCWRRWLAN